MTKAPGKSIRYGDHVFRQCCAGRDPTEVRRELASLARASIQRSISAGISVRNTESDWPWLRRLRKTTGGSAT
jgi:hypothetical protein